MEAKCTARGAGEHCEDAASRRGFIAGGKQSRPGGRGRGKGRGGGRRARAACAGIGLSVVSLSLLFVCGICIRFGLGKNQSFRDF